MCFSQKFIYGSLLYRTRRHSPFLLLPHAPPPLASFLHLLIYYIPLKEGNFLCKQRKGEGQIEIQTQNCAGASASRERKRKIKVNSIRRELQAGEKGNDLSENMFFKLFLSLFTFSLFFFCSPLNAILLVTSLYFSHSPRYDLAKDGNKKRANRNKTFIIKKNFQLRMEAKKKSCNYAIIFTTATQFESLPNCKCNYILRAFNTIL